MIKAIIHAGGESTRIREVYSGPKAIAPAGIPPRSLLWLHLQPLIKSGVISEYFFTLRYKSGVVQKHIDKLAEEFGIKTSSVVEPRPLGRAGVVRYAIEKGLLDVNETHLMSHPDDLIPIDVKKLIEFKSEAERSGKILVLIMTKYAMTPFGIGKINEEFEVEGFEEKPELPLPPRRVANSGMALYMPEAMKEFLKVPKGKLVHPEDSVIPKLIKEKKVAAFVIPRWISVNYKSDYLRIRDKKLEDIIDFLTKVGRNI